VVGVVVVEVAVVGVVYNDSSDLGQLRRSTLHGSDDYEAQSFHFAKIVFGESTKETMTQGFLASSSKLNGRLKRSGRGW